jgi:hypothetical protein
VSPSMGTCCRAAGRGVLLARALHGCTSASTVPVRGGSIKVEENNWGSTSNVTCVD